MAETRECLQEPGMNRLLFVYTRLKKGGYYARYDD